MDKMNSIDKSLNKMENSLGNMDGRLDFISGEINKADLALNKYKKILPCFIFNINDEGNKSHFFRWGYHSKNRKNGFRIFYECHNNDLNRFEIQKPFGETTFDIRLKFFPFFAKFLEAFAATLDKEITNREDENGN